MLPELLKKVFERLDASETDSCPARPLNPPTPKPHPPALQARCVTSIAATSSLLVRRLCGGACSTAFVSSRIRAQDEIRVQEEEQHDTRVAQGDLPPPMIDSSGATLVECWFVLWIATQEG